MNKFTVKATIQLKTSLPPERKEEAYVAQMPRITCNMGTRMLFLKPGIDMRKQGEHPDSLTTDLRNPRLTYLSWLPGMSEFNVIISLEGFSLFSQCAVHTGTSHLLEPCCANYSSRSQERNSRVEC